MIGYLNLPLSILYPHEKIFYQAAYCSICRNFSKKKLFLNRFLLNYDTIFFYLLFITAYPSYKFNLKPFLCKLNFQKRFYIKDNGIIDYFSDYSSFFSLLKFYDNFLDEKFPISNLNYILYKIFLNNLEYIDKNYLTNTFNKINKKRISSKDNEIIILSSILENIFPYDYLNYKYKDKISIIISNLIKLIFYIDALDDLTIDKKKKKDNILISKFNFKSDEQNLQKIKSECTFSINYSLDQLQYLPNKDFLRMLKIYFTDLIPMLLDKALLKNGINSIFTNIEIK